MYAIHEKKAKVFKALCDPKRIAIIELLRTGEKCACVLSQELNIAQSALSYHMKILCESQLVECWNVGKWTHYQISAQGRTQAIELLQSITCPAPRTEHGAPVKACTAQQRCTG